MVARASINLGVQRRETRAADKLRTNDRQTVLLYRYRSEHRCALPNHSWIKLDVNIQVDWLGWPLYPTPK